MATTRHLRRREVLSHAAGVALEVLVGHPRMLALGENHFTPITVADNP